MWLLQTPGADGSPQVLLLPAEGTAHIAKTPGGAALRLVHELRQVGDTEIGRITVGAFGVKLEAIDRVLSILPDQRILAMTNGQSTPYELQPRAGERTEICLLRHGDVVTSPESTNHLTCTWTSSEVQVTSSAADGAGAAQLQTHGVDGIAETPEEEETEDEYLDDIDTTITAVKATQSKSQQGATPQLSDQRSIVQETPTAARVNVVEDRSAIPRLKFGEDHLQLQERTPTPEPMDQVEPEPYSTTRTGQSQNGGQASTTAVKDTNGTMNDTAVLRLNSTSDNPMLFESESESARSVARQLHPEVLITRKRPSPALNEPESETDIMGRKRARTAAPIPSENETQDSREGNIAVDISPAPAPKSRKRKSMTKEEAGEATPSRSQRSQRSVTAPEAEPYDGETPCVATSNSSITANSQAAKFLKKQGGSLVDSVKESFNVLCVRDGDLHKTPKVLQAIAAGISIVTDKWLTDSAKAGHFLSVDAYKPSAPKKEKEWNFELQKVLSEPQTPFEGYTLHFTTSLHSVYKPFTEIEQICKAAGADKVTKKKMDKSENVIVLAVDETDKEAEKLMADGISCFNRDLIPMSIFRGVLDLDSDEFKINAEPKKKRGRKG